MSTLYRFPKRHGLTVDQVLLCMVCSYLILWLLEGGLRRWILPQFSGMLLLVRDPLVIGTYLFAFSYGRFPNNAIVWSCLLLAVSECLVAIFGHGNPLVTMYGLRCDFLHIPMIFIVAKVLATFTLSRLFRWALWLAVPSTVLLIFQFYSPQSAWVNRGLGGSLEGAGFGGGALGRFRPPGTFSFITGPACLYPILAACWIAAYRNNWASKTLLILSATAIVLAIPISISRSLFIATLLVVIAGGVESLWNGQLRVSSSGIASLAAGGVAIAVAISQPIFTDGMDAFGSRWKTSTTDSGGIREAMVDRMLGDTFDLFFSTRVPIFGVGTGYSTNVGQVMLTGKTGFGMEESEWGRYLFDNGLLVGFLDLALRFSLLALIVVRALQFAQAGGRGALAFVAAAGPLLVIGQWGQATIQGASVIATGIALAISRMQLAHDAAGGGRDAHRKMIFNLPQSAAFSPQKSCPPASSDSR